MSSHSYRHVSSRESEYPSSSSPSMSPSGRGVYSLMASEVAKKKRGDQRPSAVTSPSVGHHPVSSTSAYHSARDSMYHPRHPSSPPQTYVSHSSRSYPASSQPSSHHHYQHHEPPSLPHHHRMASPSGSPGAGGTYNSSGSSHPSSRSMNLPPGAQSSSTSSPPKAMSMSNLLHPLPPHHSRQGPM